jgi:hypothetical protein
MRPELQTLGFDDTAVLHNTALDLVWITANPFGISFTLLLTVRLFTHLWLLASEL